MDSAELRDAIAANIRRRAKRRRLTLVQLADLAGVSHSQLWRVLRCEATPTAEWILKLATALECNPSQLLP